MKAGSSFGSEISIDTVVLLTRTKLYVATYNDDAEKLLDVVICSLDDIAKIEASNFFNKRMDCLMIFIRYMMLQEKNKQKLGTLE